MTGPLDDAVQIIRRKFDVLPLKHSFNERLALLALQIEDRNLNRRATLDVGVQFVGPRGHLGPERLTQEPAVAHQLDHVAGQTPFGRVLLAGVYVPEGGVGLIHHDENAAEGVHEPAQLLPFLVGAAEPLVAQAGQLDDDPARGPRVRLQLERFARAVGAGDQNAGDGGPAVLAALEDLANDLARFLVADDVVRCVPGVDKAHNIIQSGLENLVDLLDHELLGDRFAGTAGDDQDVAQTGQIETRGQLYEIFPARLETDLLPGQKVIDEVDSLGLVGQRNLEMIDAALAEDR